jgi:hypothetical protein
MAGRLAIFAQWMQPKHSLPVISPPRLFTSPPTSNQAMNPPRFLRPKLERRFLWHRRRYLLISACGQYYAGRMYRTFKRAKQAMFARIR